MFHPDVVFINGTIHTVDTSNRTVEAVAVSGNRFSAVGTTEEILSLASPQTQVIDLKGSCVVPGIMDSHNHVFNAGTLLDGVMLFGARTIAEMQDRVRNAVEHTQGSGWVLGGGWIESQFIEYRLPTRHDLDEASPHNPVLLDRLFGACVVNSAALKLAGIDRNTPDPERGQIDRDEHGDPTGVLRNGAQSIVRHVIPKGDVQEEVSELERLAKLALGDYPRYGITSVLDPGVSPLGMRAYQNLYNNAELNLRVNMMPAWYGLYSTSGKDLSSFIDIFGAYSGLGNEWLNVGALKMAIDGGLGSKTAMCHQPFLDGSKSTIPLRLDLDKLEEYFRAAQTAGWSIGIHCCGDLAQDIALETFDKVISEIPNPRARHNIIHGYLPTPKALAIMQKHNIGVSTQPGFMYVEGDIYFDVVEFERIDYFKPLKTYDECGIKVSCNSDVTSAHYNPFLGMYAAVARKTSQGRSLGKTERIDRKTMLRMFTINGAYFAFNDHQIGSIEVGKLADMAVLSDDIYTVAEEDILNMNVKMTVIDGKIVYQA